MKKKIVNVLTLCYGIGCPILVGCIFALVNGWMGVLALVVYLIFLEKVVNWWENNMFSNENSSKRNQSE